MSSDLSKYEDGKHRSELTKTKVMVSKIGQVIVRPSSKKDPCGICGRKTMLDAVLCESCANWIHGRCAKNKKVTNRLEYC